MQKIKETKNIKDYIDKLSSIINNVRLLDKNLPNEYESKI
jgi:hypothetical protein